MKKRLALLLSLAAILALTATTVIFVKFGLKDGKSETHTSSASSSDTDLSVFTPLLFSPMQNITVETETDDNGALAYTVRDDNGLTLIKKSYIGMRSDECDFSNGLTFVSRTPVKIVDETYTNLSGKRSTVRNYYSETVMTFEKDAFFFDVTFRAYEDGFAYRFGIRTKDGSQTSLTAVAETGTFSLPGQSQITAQLINDVNQKFCYEEEFSTLSVEALSQNSSPYVCFPALVSVANENGKQTGRYLLLSEAELVGSGFYGSVLRVEGHNQFGMHPAPIASQQPVTIDVDFLSPWRFGIYGTPGDLVMSDMAENLAAPPQGDFSWVEPGVTGWMWLSERKKGQRDPDTIRKYIRLASEMGWKYLTLDEGWQPDCQKPGKVYEGYFNWFDDIVKYADRRGVGLIVWVKYEDIDTHEERETVLRDFAAKGIKGIKADFFDNEDQDTINSMHEIYRICAECHLTVNCHGAGKPTGERRTYPNVINREAVRGEEFYLKHFVNESVVWAFTRNVVGPMDITPRVYPFGDTHTLGMQLASCVILESGTPCMAGNPMQYQNYKAASFYRNLPAAWDDTVYVDGAIGDYVTIARRSGDNWYAASVTEEAKQDMTMPLTFLGDGEYEATIYSDKNRDHINITAQTVTKSDVLHYRMLQKSGYAVTFIKKAS